MNPQIALFFVIGIMVWQCMMTFVGGLVIWFTFRQLGKGKFKIE